MKNYKTIIATVVLGLACSAFTGKAALVALTSGQQNVDNSGSSYTVGGTAIATLVTPYNAGPGVDIGTITTTVFQGDPSGYGGLTFLYTLSVTTGDFNSLTVNGYSSPVGVAIVSGTTVGATASFINGFLRFNWASAAAAPSTISIAVATSIPFYGPSVGSVQDGVTANGPILAPVPEPSTVLAGVLMLLPFGIGAVRSLRKERA
jgi:hypothetical protein